MTPTLTSVLTHGGAFFLGWLVCATLAKRHYRRAIEQSKPEWPSPYPRKKNSEK